MRSLDVRFCPLTNLGFKSVSRAMPDLERVPLEGCPITSIGVWRLFCRYRGINLWPSGAQLLAFKQAQRAYCYSLAAIDAMFL